MKKYLVVFVLLTLSSSIAHAGFFTHEIRCSYSGSSNLEDWTTSVHFWDESGLQNAASTCLTTGGHLDVWWAEIRGGGEDHWDVNI